MEDLTKAAVEKGERLQDMMGKWVVDNLGEAVFLNVSERALRVVEETIELAQSLGVQAETIHRTMLKVYSKPHGSPFQEMGGVMTTLLALGASTGMSLAEATGKEIARIHQPEVIERIKRRNAENMQDGTGIPG